MDRRVGIGIGTIVGYGLTLAAIVLAAVTAGESNPAVSPELLAALGTFLAGTTTLGRQGQAAVKDRGVVAGNPPALQGDPYQPARDALTDAIAALEPPVPATEELPAVQPAPAPPANPPTGG
jgi:hypothetical protein